MKKNMRVFGLIGRKLGHSFSKEYFGKKFVNEQISEAEYTNYELRSITEFPELLKTESQICGLNVTIPYKEEILPFIDHLDTSAKAIGAVNTLQFQADGSIKGYNTDWIGFRDSLTQFLGKETAHTHLKALVLGTGGSAKAVWYALDSLGIAYTKVSRLPNGDPNLLQYEEIQAETIFNHRLIINTTPLGMYPDTEAKPAIPYSAITEDHYAFDLIYNPEHTEFLLSAALYGAHIRNGRDMLERQAEAAWQIWNS